MNTTGKGPRSFSCCAHANAFLALACSVALFAFMVGCSSNSSSSSPPPPPPQSVMVMVSSSSSSVLLGNTLQFTATVTGTSNTAVTWSVNGVAGGNSTLGTISSSGLYTAPSDLPSSPLATVKATSQADASANGSTSITVTSDIKLALATNPSSVPSLQAAISVQLVATLSSAGNPDKTVLWSVNGVTNGNATVGSISGSGLSVVYTAPAVVSAAGTVNVQASSMADSSKSASVMLSINTLSNFMSGSFNFQGSYPAPTNVTFKDQLGRQLSVVAFPGQISIKVTPTIIDAASVAQLVTANAGTIIAQIPNAGLYWAQVTPGNEATFITAILSNGAVIDATPHIPLFGAQSAPPVDLSGAQSTTPVLPGSNVASKFDGFNPQGPIVCGFTHGDAVDQILGQGGISVNEYDVSQAQLSNAQLGIVAQPDLTMGLGRAIVGAFQQASQQGQRYVANVSLQAIGQPNDDSQGLNPQSRDQCEIDPQQVGCSAPSGGATLGNYASWKKNESDVLADIAQNLQWMPPNQLDNTLVVVSAGNSGLNLTAELGIIQSRYPQGFAHMIVVGGLGTNGQPFAGQNHSDDATQMLYASGVGVTIPGTNGCTDSGTSFAAPLVTVLATKLAQAFPQLTTAQIRQAILNAAPLAPLVPGISLPTIPTLAQAQQAAQALLSGGQSSVQQFAGTVSGSGLGSCVQPVGGNLTVAFSGRLVIQTTPALTSIGSSGGSFSGNWSVGGSATLGGCADPTAGSVVTAGTSGQVSGQVDTSGNVSITMTSVECSITGSGTKTSLSGSGTCFVQGGTGTGTFTASSP